MSERELITVGFGNFATLVATQWVNGTSRFDVEHNTLYTDASTDSIVTQRDAVHGAGARQTRVPRLLMLDDADECAAYCRTVAPLHCIDVLDAPRGESNDEEDEVEPPRNAMSRMVQSAQRHWWRRRSSETDEDEEEAQSSYSSEHDEEEKHEGRGRRRRESGFMPWAVRDTTRHSNNHHTGSRTSKNNTKDDNHNRKDDYANCNNNNNNNNNDEKMRQHQYSDPAVATTAHLARSDDTQPSPAEDTCCKNDGVPWWRFITTSLHRRSILTRSQQQQRQAGVHLHKFGYGLTDDRSSSATAGGAGLAQDDIQDALRHQLEDSDRAQGLQCFTDGNSMFGGCAHRTLHDLWDEAGAKLSVVHFTLITPPPWLLYGDTDAHAARDVTVLNRLLATSMLSAPGSVVYVPLELDRWADFFAASASSSSDAAGNESRRVAPAWLRSEQAVAQYVAAMADAALYGARDGTYGDVHDTRSANSSGNNNPRNACHDGRTMDSSDRDVYCESAVGPAFYVDAWCRALRPAPSMRVTAALAALPLSVRPPASFSGASYLPGGSSWYPLRGRPSRAQTAGSDAESAGGVLWQWLCRSPLLTPSLDDESCVTRLGSSVYSDGDGFTALTHAMTRRADTEAGRVLGHALSLRGLDGRRLSEVASHRTAMTRYGQAVGQSASYIPLVTRHAYPCSSTFPDILLHTSRTGSGSDCANDCVGKGEGASGRARPTRVGVASHIVNTFSSASMLREVVTDGQEVWRTRGHRYREGYGLERDDWTERLEEVWQMHDDYRHGEPSNASSDEDECGADD